MLKYEIRDMPESLPEALVAKLLKVETPSVGHLRLWGFMDRGIAAIIPERRIVGCAVTVATPGPDAVMVHHTLGLLRPGDVMVVDRLGDTRYACWGGGTAVGAMAGGAVGAIIDGPITDEDEIREMGFPMWCRGNAPITTRMLDIGGTLNLDISCGGAVVHPGDVILADSCGVVVLPRAQANAIADAALARQERGATNHARVAKGEKLGDLSGASRMVAAALKAGKQAG